MGWVRYIGVNSWFSISIDVNVCVCCMHLYICVCIYVHTCKVTPHLTSLIGSVILSEMI